MGGILGVDQAFILFEFVYIGDTDWPDELAELPVKSESLAGSGMVNSQ